nr:AAA family ATPase [FCB group bacterium]
AILNIYKDKRIRLASPTGKAAKRMEEATGLPACTVHRLLEYDPVTEGFIRGSEVPLDADMVVIDEVSMMDVWLTDCLLKAIAPGTKLILVGDADQLPSVGPGNVLTDLLSCEWIPSIKLTQIMRQAEASTIIKNAHRINRGLPIDIYSKKDFFFIEEDDPDLLVKRIRKLVTEDIPKKFKLDSINDIQVLCPQNVGNIGSIVFNNALQRSLNPARDNKPEVKIGGDDNSYYLRVGDRVIQTVNNYTLGVFNGTTGVIADVDPQSRKVWVDFGNGCKKETVEPTCQSALDRRPQRTPARTGGSLEVVAYEHEQLPQLKLAYAISIHKSQGSEFPCVVIPIHFLNKRMLVRNLLYTSITRGKKLVVIVGNEAAVDFAIDNNNPTQRYTLLRKFLNNKIPIYDEPDRT